MCLAEDFVLSQTDRGEDYLFTFESVGIEGGQKCFLVQILTLIGYCGPYFSTSVPIISS